MSPAGKKVLVFGYHKKVLDEIEAFLAKRKREEKEPEDFIRIDGDVSTAVRHELCDRFQSQKTCKTALLGIKASSVRPHEHD